MTSEYGPATFVALCNVKLPDQLTVKFVPLFCRLSVGLDDTAADGTTSPVERIRPVYVPDANPAGSMN